MPNIVQPDKTGNLKPGAEVHSGHPYNHQKNHDALRQYVLDRVHVGLKYRDGMVNRYAKVDKQVAGYLELSDEDKIRERKKSDTGQQLAVEVNLPLTHIHIDDMCTYIAETVAPMKGIYHAVDNAEDQDMANAVTAEMNTHAENTDHFSAITRAGLAALKYNICGLEVEWHTEFAPTFEGGRNGVEKVWEANKLNHLDMYNTFWDTCVSPQEVPTLGEYAGKVTRVSAFTLKRLVDSGIYANVKSVKLKEEQTRSSSSGSDHIVYYRDAAAEVGLETGNDSTGKESGDTNWMVFLGAGTDHTAGTGVDLVTTYIWLNPYERNLVPKNKNSKDAGRNTIELWKIVIASGETVVYAKREESLHGYIPMCFGAINYDDLGVAQRSVAEIIDPLQTFASFALNTHIQATRKNIWDLIVYDDSIVDLSQIPKGESAARLKVKEAGRGTDLNKAIWQNGNLIDTRQTVEDMNMIMGLLQTFYPTQSMPSQIAGMDRAIESQVAAVTQGTTRRMKQAVRVLDSTLFRMSRAFQYYNILQFQTTPLQIVKPTGQRTEVTVVDLRKRNILTSLGQGLKTMDREIVVKQLTALTQMVLQSSTAVQQTDIMKLIDKISDYMGIEVDFNQFRIQQPPPTGGEQGDVTGDTGAVETGGADVGGLPQ